MESRRIHFVYTGYMFTRGRDGIPISCPAACRNSLAVGCAYLITMMNLIICSFLLSGSLLQCVVGDTFYIVTSPQSACPDNYTGDACLTLNQFATHQVSSWDITLEMQPGNHSLGSQGLRMELKNLFKMQLSGSGMSNIVCSADDGFSLWIQRY